MTIAVLIWAIPAALVTAVLAFLARYFAIGRLRPRITLSLVSTALPAIMVADGLRLSWPWPWRQPQEMQDMLPLGPWLIIAAAPSWVLCLLVSALVLRRWRV